MTIFRFSNGHVVTPTGVLNDATIVVEDGRIARIGASDGEDSTAAG
jgi:imidazolonepropionase-like amidohydrolase